MKDTILPVALSYVSGLLLLIAFMFFGYQKAYNTHKEILLSSVENSFKNAVKRYQDFATSTYKAKFKNDKETSYLLYIANKNKNQRNQIRKRIYQKYKSDYQLLKDVGVKQFQIHLKDNITSLIRFHQLEKWGDSLKGIRKTVELCLLEGKPIHGFEEGRYFSGFRNVYPIKFKNKTVASVEISIGLNAIASEAIMDVKKDFAKFILRKDIYGKKVWSKKLEEKYKLSSIDSNFIEDKSDIEYMWDIENEVSKIVDKIEKDISEDFKGKLKTYKKYSKLEFVEGKAVLVFFVPFKDIDGNFAGYFVYFKNDESWKSFIFFLIGIGIILFILYTAVFSIILNQHINILMYRAKDQLTGAWQKRCGFRLAENLFREIKKNKKPLSVVFIDIDNFKKINDTYGHKIGDLALSAVSKIINERIRDKDIFLRYGGEELVIILPDTDIEGAYTVAEDIRHKVEKLFIPPVGRITISAGVAQLKEGESLPDLLHKADEAMYKAKKSGKNRVEKYEES